jgi:hypothetical protein
MWDYRRKLKLATPSTIGLRQKRTGVAGFILRQKRKDNAELQTQAKACYSVNHWPASEAYWSSRIYPASKT